MKTTIRLLCTALLAAPIAGHATPITYNFAVDGGPMGALAGVKSSGYFSFDSSIIPVGGGLRGLTGLLTDLAFTWNGISYEETTANTGSLSFDPSGALTGALFGTTCKPNGCDVSSRTIGWDISWGLHSQFFTYSFGNGKLGFGTATISAAPAAAVPEPGSVGLLALGLGALLLARLRRTAREHDEPSTARRLGGCYRTA